MLSSQALVLGCYLIAGTDGIATLRPTYGDRRTSSSPGANGQIAVLWIMPLAGGLKPWFGARCGGMAVHAISESVEVYLIGGEDQTKPRGMECSLYTAYTAEKFGGRSLILRQVLFGHLKAFLRGSW